ncbi:saccharopine dehydrogenase NADP-binding domain-containing protein [Acidobacteriota bacterium]
MSRFLVLGAGKMGMVLAKDLVNSNHKNKVTLVDISFGQLKEASEFIGNERLIPVQRDVEDKEHRKEIFKDQDVAINALLHRHSLLVLEEAVRRGVHFVDLVGESPMERLKYDEEATKRGVAAILGLGVSPGITNVCVGRAVFLLDETEKALIYVGGESRNS